MPLRYGSAVSALTWQADLVRDEAGVALPSARLVLETGVTAGGVTTWTPSITVQSGAELDAGHLELAAPAPCDRYRLRIELDFVAIGQAAHRESAALRTSVVFAAGAWVVLDSPWWTIRSLADLLQRAELGRELRPAGYDGSWDVCIARLPLGAEVRGRRGERLRARIAQPGDALRMLEIRAVTDAWHEET
jgi:hypothetical protein